MGYILSALLIAGSAAFALPARAGDVTASYDTGAPAAGHSAPAIRDFADILLPPVPEAARAKKIKPLILTVSGVDFGEIGVGLELKHILWLWQKLYPGKPADQDLIRKQLEEIRKSVEEECSRIPNLKDPPAYLFKAIKNAAERNHIDAEVHLLKWNRDPDQSREAVEHFKKRLVEYNSYAAREKMPLYIVAHSWGTVLANESLLELEREGVVIPVERFVTMGSPLVPGKLWLKIFAYFEDVVGKLQSAVTRPAGVKYWVNFYADRDIISNVIRAADLNIRVDVKADPYEERLKDIIHSMPVLGKADLKKITNPGAWHCSYYGGFHAELKSLDQTLSWDVLEDNFSYVLPR